MKSKIAFIAVSAVILLSLIVMFAVSIERKDELNLRTDAPLKIDSVIADNSEPINDDIDDLLIPFEPEPEETFEVSFADVRDVAFWDDRIAAGTAEGIFTYRVSDSSYQFFHHANGLTDSEVGAILPYDGKLLVGTETGLAQIDQAGNITRIDFGYETPVTALAEADGTLLIGTRLNGLIAYWNGSSSQLLDVLDISSVISAGDHIWVATYGNGLYSFDGMEWKQRFLIRDTAAFDYVTDLGYRFNRLYAGTDYGLWVFDGGKWKLYDDESGLYACNVTAVDFLGWKIIAGTSGWGIYEIFEDVVNPKAWSEGLEVTTLASNENMLVVGTPDQGIYIAEGKTVSHINPTPQTLTEPIVALAD
jgi:ligand-binding sensor domain-containing protein